MHASEDPAVSGRDVVVQSPKTLKPHLSPRATVPHTPNPNPQSSPEARLNRSKQAEWQQIASHEIAQVTILSNNRVGAQEEGVQMLGRPKTAAQVTGPGKKASLAMLFRLVQLEVLSLSLLHWSCGSSSSSCNHNNNESRSHSGSTSSPYFAIRLRLLPLLFYLGLPKLQRRATTAAAPPPPRTPPPHPSATTTATTTTPPPAAAIAAAATFTVLVLVLALLPVLLLVLLLVLHY